MNLWKQRAVEPVHQNAKLRAASASALSGRRANIIIEKDGTGFTVQGVVDRSRQSCAKLHLQFDGKHGLCSPFRRCAGPIRPTRSAPPPRATAIHRPAQGGHPSLQVVSAGPLRAKRPLFTDFARGCSIPPGRGEVAHAPLLAPAHRAHGEAADARPAPQGHQPAPHGGR